MTYRVELSGHAVAQASSLPTDAFDALAARVVDLVEEPWDATVMPPGNDPAYRRTTFGAGWGLVTFHVDDAAGLVQIFHVLWAG